MPVEGEAGAWDEEAGRYLYLRSQNSQTYPKRLHYHHVHVNKPLGDGYLTHSAKARLRQKKT